MKSIYIAILFFMSYVNTSQACSCAYIGTFCETITFGGAISSSYLIVHATVENKSASEMSVRIIDVLFGNPSQNTLVIPNGNGADCRESISNFTVGNSYIFAVYDHGEFGYSLSICGVSWLTIEDNMVKGPIAPNLTSLPIQDFPQLQECGNIGTTLTTISVNPTLTSDKIMVKTSAENLLVEIEMYDMMGRIVFTRHAYQLMASDPLTIAVDHLPSGCYTIVTESIGIRRTFRVVVVS